MNHAKLKDYAPKARLDFIEAVTDRAAFYGVTAQEIAPVTVQGDVAIIAGRAVPASLVRKRTKLLERIERDGFDQTMEALAYTWFNRFVAIRYMELHGYLEHGYRVLSHPDPAKTIPEILEFAEHVELPGLSKEQVIDLKLDTNKEPELYRRLVLAQCHVLNAAMPFLFEAIDDETELVLPENLLHSDSIVRNLVAASDPADWREVEVLGWLYQYYISKRKDEVMARKSAVPAEDIPAVTQLFTPHWIVRYLIENSLGRLWLLSRPGSKLREHMPYYIEGEPEADFLKINRPEDIRLLDPACGSGHMLAYAFDLLFLMYQEEGHVSDEIPALILQHNLFGLEICPRATQLAGLAIVLKARERFRRFFQPDNLVEPRILALRNIQFSEGELGDYRTALDLGEIFNEGVIRLLHQFEEATTLGSLIQPCVDEVGISSIRRSMTGKVPSRHLFLSGTHDKVQRALKQAEELCRRYHVVVTNPPYMGTKAIPLRLAIFAKEHFSNTKSDTSAMFVERGVQLALPFGTVAMITMQSWMFLSSLKTFRTELLTANTIVTMAHCGVRAFDSIGGEVVSTTAFVVAHCSAPSYRGTFVRLISGRSEREKDELLRSVITLKGPPSTTYRASVSDFFKMPGCPIAYWASAQILRLFSKEERIGDIVKPRQGMSTNDNCRFLRQWFEVSGNKIGLGCSSSLDAVRSGRKWFPYNKGGPLRKWYGNYEYVVNWYNDGEEIKHWLTNNPKDPNTSHWSRRIINTEFYFRPGITWADITTTSFAARHADAGSLFDVKGSSAFPDSKDHHCLLGLMNSCLMNIFMMILNPTVTFQVGDISRVPFVRTSDPEHRFDARVDEMISVARRDWDASETSWSFGGMPLLRPNLKERTLETSWQNWEAHCMSAIRRMQELETENNRLFIDAYGLSGEVQPEVPEEQITLARPDAGREMSAFLSYAVGCMMGRYSLDHPGLILANVGDHLAAYLEKVGKPLAELTFRPNEDGIIPVLDGEWFAGDIATRSREFLRATFGDATLEVNVHFIEESLGKDLRKYFLTDFYKDHLQTYKKRPIYWLFSSGKEHAFQALVYLHRYHEGTLSRMRTEYVIPLQGKIASRIDGLADDIQKAASTSHRKKMDKERDKLLKQQAELHAFDERLRHYADRRILLDLDDGVKVNYGKFGDLLAEVKAVTGGSDE